MLGSIFAVPALIRPCRPAVDGRDVQAGCERNVQQLFGLLIRVPMSKGLCHETQSGLGLCSVVVPVVIPIETQRTSIATPLVEAQTAG